MTISYRVGELVRFHPIIGGKHDQNLYRLICIGMMDAFLDGKGWVDARAISKNQPGADNYGVAKYSKPTWDMEL